MALENTPKSPQPDNKLHIADDNPYLNYDALYKACEAIFEEKIAIPYEEFKDKTINSYQIDMEEYAKLHNFTDAVKLTEYFSYVCTKIESKLDKRTKEILVLGCGQGRLVDVYVALAKKLGITGITFNDLNEIHIQQTEQKIRDIYNTDGSSADGITVNYLPGDIATVDISRCFDAAFSIWYVSAELLDPSSVENMRKFRNQVYSKLNDILIPGGGLIEDIPDPNMAPGFYEIANFKTAHILEQKGILPGEHHNLLLSNWTPEQSAGFPYQLRYTPRNGTDVKEKAKAGFILRKTESSAIPVRSISDKKLALESIKQTSNIWETIRLLNELMLKTVILPDGDQIDQKRRKITWWERI